MTHMPEFLKTKLGLFGLRYVTTIIVFLCFYFAITYKTPTSYISLATLTTTLIFMEANFFLNFNMITEKSYTNHDKVLYEEIKSILPPLGSLKRAKETDFRNSFPSYAFTDIAGFIYFIEYSVDKRFQDFRLEQLRVEITKFAEEFISNIAEYTYTCEDKTMSSLPLEWRDSEDKALRLKFEEEATLLSNSALNLANAYGQLTAQAIKNLYTD